MGNIARPDTVGCVRQGLAQEPIGRWFVSQPVACSGDEGFRLDGAQPPFRNNSPDSCRSARDACIGQLAVGSTIAVTTSVALGHLFDQLSQFAAGTHRRRGLGGVVVAAARHFEDSADRKDTVAGGVVDGINHFANLGWGLVRRITAAFLERRSRGGGGRFRVAGRAYLIVRCGLLAYGSQNFAPDPRALRCASPRVEQDCADTKFLSQFGDRSASCHEFDGLSLELGRCIAFFVWWCSLMETVGFRFRNLAYLMKA